MIGTLSCKLFGHKFTEKVLHLEWPPEYMDPRERVIRDPIFDYHCELNAFCVRCGFPRDLAEKIEGWKNSPMIISGKPIKS